ncbi:hypothetical protein H696_06201, partial [Fonticula alba]
GAGAGAGVSSHRPPVGRCGGWQAPPDDGRLGGRRGGPPSEGWGRSSSGPWRPEGLLLGERAGCRARRCGQGQGCCRGSGGGGRRRGDRPEPRVQVPGHGQAAGMMAGSVRAPKGRTCASVCGSTCVRVGVGAGVSCRMSPSPPPNPHPACLLFLVLSLSLPLCFLSSRPALGSAALPWCACARSLANYTSHITCCSV